MLAYERDPYLQVLETRVIDSSDASVVLEDTICFPGGGGQPADRGWLAGTPVSIERDGEALRHVLASGASPPEVGSVVKLELDWPRRYELMQHHTAEHLLASLALHRFGWATRSFSLGEETCTIDLDVPGLGRAQLDELEQAAAEVIRDARPVAARWVTPEEYADLAARSRRLPEGHTGDLRLVEIDGVDLNTCGGTHVRSTAELGILHLVDAEPNRGGSRVTFVCGERLRRQLTAHEERTAELRTLLRTHDDDLVATARLKLEQLKEAARRERQLLAELAAAVARELAAEPDTAVGRYLPDRDPEFLLEIAKAFQVLAPERTALLTCGPAKAGAYLLAIGSDSSVDAEATHALVTEQLEARGGGRQGMFRGKANLPGMVGSVLERLGTGREEG